MIREVGSQRMETRGKRKALSCAHLVFTLLTDTKMKKNASPRLNVGLVGKVGVWLSR